VPYYDQEKRGTFLGWAFALTLILHWLVWWQLGSFPFFSPSDSSKTQSKKEDAIVLEPLPPSLRQKQIVQTNKAKEDPEAEKEKARFGGEFRNRVKKETRSANQGRFQQAQPKAGGSKSPLGPDGALAPSLSDLMPRFSSSPYQLPGDVEAGSDTMLNTDAVSYASFFNRIADMIYDPWARYVREALSDPLVQKKLQATDYVTKLLIILDREGRVTAIQLVQSSGLDALDEAPKKAFWSVSPFHNPPRQLYKTDDYVRLRYQFTVPMRSSSFNILPWSG
jgi:TonB family protein